MKIEIIVKNGFPILKLDGVVVCYEKKQNFPGGIYVMVESTTAKPYFKAEAKPEKAPEAKPESISQAVQMKLAEVINATSFSAQQNAKPQFADDPGPPPPKTVNVKDTLGKTERTVLEYFEMNPGKTKNTCARTTGLLHETVSAIVEHLLKANLLARGPGERSKVYYSL